MGRPSSYTIELAAAICERLAAGESLRAICKDEGMPSDMSVRRWALDNVDGFSSRYACARELGFDALADEALDIADTTEVGVRSERSDDGYKETREDMLGHRKLRVDTRKWLLAKWAPQKYGERQAIEMSGTLALSSMSEDEIKAELAAYVAGDVNDLL